MISQVSVSWFHGLPVVIRLKLWLGGRAFGIQLTGTCDTYANSLEEGDNFTSTVNSGKNNLCYQNIIENY